MRLRMLAPPVARVVEDRGRRPGAAERAIVADVNPEPPVSVLPLASTGTVGRVGRGAFTLGLSQNRA